MRGRKFLSGLLCGALAVALAVPALAEAPSADQALSAVTAKVKDTLGLDTEIFTEFQGHADEDVLLGKRWSLEWSGDGVWLNITADDNGKVYAYDRSESVNEEPITLESRYLGGKLNIPRLPEDKSAAAFQTAQDFLNKVLEAPVESVEMENTYSPSLTQSTYRYSGVVRLNGLPSPISCSISVRASDLQVTRFWRDDQSAGYLGGVPSAATTVTEAAARRALTGTVEMKARYVLQEDGKTAKVQYLPVYGHDYYVDGVTGELIDLTELREKLRKESGAGGAYRNSFAVTDEAPEAAADMKATLTKAETEGAAILAQALSKEELDKALQNAWPELGLSAYTLASASYSIQEKEIGKDAERTPDDYTVTCRLVYGKQEGQVLRNKYVSVDAKTGELQSLYSRRYYQGEGKDSPRYATTLTQGQATAADVLQSFAGKNFAALGLFESSDAQKNETWEHSYTYQHTDGTYFYDGNSFTVGVDATDGTISRLSGHFDDSVILEVPAKVIDARTAAEIYANAMAMPYSYLEVPVSISLAGRELMPLLKEAGYSYVQALKTGFGLTQPENQYIQGVDAQTGEVVKRDYTPGEREGITYDDIEGHWIAPAAKTLAVFDVGLRGGSLKPDETLKQLDMIALLMSVEGYSFDPTTATKDDADWLYQRAYSLGLVTPETRNEAKAVTRGELVRVILDTAGYTRIAAIPGIFRCDFADSAAISAQDMGYAALAQGLGLVKGGSDGSYAGGRDITRAEAVSMLYQYMK